MIEVESIGKPTSGPLTSHGESLKKFSQLYGLRLLLATEIVDEKINSHFHEQPDSRFLLL